MSTIFHIAYAEDWERARAVGRYTVSSRGRSLDDEGFIHASTAAQVAATANRFYAGETGLVVLALDPDALDAEVRYEPPAPGASELFPHIYGPVLPSAVTAVLPLPTDQAGRFIFPSP